MGSKPKSLYSFHNLSHISDAPALTFIQLRHRSLTLSCLGYHTTFLSANFSPAPYFNLIFTQQPEGSFQNIRPMLSVLYSNPSMASPVTQSKALQRTARPFFVISQTSCTLTQLGNLEKNQIPLPLYILGRTTLYPWYLNFGIVFKTPHVIPMYR